MSGSTLSRRLCAVLCLASLALAGGSSLGATAITGGAACESVEATARHAANPSHHCLPVKPPRLEACRSAPCCALAPASEHDGQRALVSSPAAGEPASPPRHLDAVVTIEPRHLAVETEGSPPTGRERLALHAVLLI